MKLIKKICNSLNTKFFLRLFLLQIVVIIAQKIYGVSYISDEMTLGAMGFIATLIGIYTAEKVKGNKKDDAPLP